MALVAFVLGHTEPKTSKVPRFAFEVHDSDSDCECSDDGPAAKTARISKD